MNKKAKSDIDWAEIIDLFASEYGWTIDYIKSLNMGQILVLIDKIQIRRKKQNNSSEGEASSIPSTEGVSPDEMELSMSDFQYKLGGKKVVENGVTKIII